MMKEPLDAVALAYRRSDPPGRKSRNAQRAPISRDGRDDEQRKQGVRQVHGQWSLPRDVQQQIKEAVSGQQEIAHYACYDEKARVTR